MAHSSAEHPPLGEKLVLKMVRGHPVVSSRKDLLPRGHQPLLSWTTNGEQGCDQMLLPLNRPPPFLKLLQRQPRLHLHSDPSSICKREQSKLSPHPQPPRLVIQSRAPSVAQDPLILPPGSERLRKDVSWPCGKREKQRKRQRPKRLKS
ncbi:hypothetical protein EMPG_15599 [Blastomyces silverae]|uniref:Uncharacterized protein n=1 Tax=Blastomyces silverae TaxID=2060906 RepID=A0A0H1BCX8_9EURO|nr:hypothetical protein EMPG_15599 [Blastomyces silverae]